MSLAASFLGGAKGRLLPRSIPFRFFVAAALFHVAMWAALFAAAGEVVSFRGGLGPALAAVHILTLGVLTATAIGAAVQLLPVATRRAFTAVWPIKLVFWLTVPGTIALIAAMFTLQTGVLVVAAVMTGTGLLLFGVLLADNLRRAQSLPVVAAHGWAALAALALLVILGVVLSANYEAGFLPRHDSIALVHLILGGFGFMGMLALGFSHVLIPMFALASAPDKDRSNLVFGLAAGAIATGAIGALVDSAPLLAAAALAGFGAAVLHVRLMLAVLKAGMRKRLGLSFVLVRAAWLMLLAAPVAGLAAVFGWAGPNGPTLFGLLLFGWLLTFLLGVLQRILPFLASMHVGGTGGAMPMLSDIAGALPLKIHAVCHGIALAALAAAIVFDSIMIMQFGSAAGFVGAAAFAWFTADVSLRVARPRPA